MFTTQFIHSEMLADEYIHLVEKAKQLLAGGQSHECLTVLKELHQQMQITLALGERYDAKVMN